MSDEEMKALARAAGDGDLDAARDLVAVIERTSADPLAAMVMERVAKRGEWAETLEVVRANATGKKLWLVGGAVYRNLAAILHGELPTGDWARTCDLDFLAAGKTKEPLLPASGWQATDRNPPEFFSRKFKIGTGWSKRDAADLICLGLAESRGCPASLEGYLEVVPLDVQAVAIDLGTHRLVGRGVEAIRAKKVSANNPGQLAEAARRQNCEPDDLIAEKAWTLGFGPRPRRLYDDGS